MWVVKIGGSVSHDAVLKHWLTELSEVGGGRVVIVPGGGDFADKVREYQGEWSFGDLSAHNMSILAMAQYGLMMQGLVPELVLATTEAKIRRALRQGRVAVWVPFQLLRDAPNGMTNWDATSDTLAAWLSATLNAERLILVKSCAIGADLTLESLAAAGVVDRQFMREIRDANYQVECLHKYDVPRMRERLLSVTT